MTPNSNDNAPRAGLRQLLPLFACLLIAALVRLIGIRWGLPDATHLFSYHPDEFHSLRGALAAAAGDPNPHFFNYGSLYLYLVAFACLWHDAVFGADLAGALLKGAAAHQQMAAWVLDARLVVVACALVTVFIVWLIGRRIIGAWGGTIAALLLALMPLHVLNSHYATVDVPQALFIGLCLYFAIRMVDDGGWKNTLWAGLSAGLAAGVKYNGIIVLIAPLVALAIGAGRLRGAHENDHEDARRGILATAALHLAILGAAAAVAFAATSPYVLIDWPHAWGDISFEIQHMRLGEAPIKHVYPNGWLFHLHISLFAGLLALIVCRGDERRRIMPVLVFAAAWFAVIGAAGVRYDRYEVPLDVAAAILAAAAFAAPWRNADITRRHLRTFLICALLGGGLIVLMQFAQLPAAWIWLVMAGWLIAYLLAARRSIRFAPLIAGTIVYFASLYMGAVCYRRDRIMTAPNVRDTMLAEVSSRIPKGETIGLLWEPWFNVPPVDYCNGGKTLRDNPLFSRFKHPIRPLAVCGADAQCLRQRRPYAVLVSEFELNPQFAEVSRRHAQVMRLLEQSGQFQQPIVLDADFLRTSPVAPSAGSDSRYPAPRLSLYLRRDHPAAPSGTTRRGTTNERVPPNRDQSSLP